LKIRIEWKRLPVIALGFHPGIETDVGEADARPSDETSDGSHICKPVEYPSCTLVDTHEGKEGEQRAEGEGGVRKTVFCCFEEELWGIASSGEAI